MFPEIRTPVVFKDSRERRLHMRRIQQIAQPHQMREPLADEMIGEAALPVLILGSLLLALLDVILAVVQPLLGESAARLKDGAVAIGRCFIAHLAGHLFRCTQRAQVQGSHHGIGTIELDVIGVVLHARHQPVPIGVPLKPGIFQGLLGAGPQLPEIRVVAAQLPIAVEL